MMNGHKEWLEWGVLFPDGEYEWARWETSGSFFDGYDISTEEGRKDLTLYWGSTLRNMHIPENAVPIKFVTRIVRKSFSEPSLWQIEDPNN